MEDIILLDYYEGAYGPTIRIDVVSTDSLHKIKDVFESLSKSAGQEVNLSTIKNVKCLDLKSLLLKSTASELDNEEQKELIFDKGNKCACWKLSIKNWQKMASLTQGLLVHNKAGHQYLTREGIDDTIIELSYLERLER